jgi:hypothetical protein
MPKKSVIISLLGKFFQSNFKNEEEMLDTITKCYRFAYYLNVYWSERRKDC